MRAPGAVPVLAALALAGCAVAGPRADIPPAGPLPTAEPMVRVGVAVNVEGVTVSSEAAYEIVDGGGSVVARPAAGEAWRIGVSDDGLDARGPDRRRARGLTPPVVVRSAGDVVTVDGMTYRGTALIQPGEAGRVTVVNTLALEAYLLGVVPHELGERPESEIEAVKAQAVAARTYAIRHLGARGGPFDFFATVADQVYRGLAGEEEVAWRAVEETRGEIVTYRGEAILAYYHSTCGGRTANVEEVWVGRDPVPYLRSVSDVTADGAYCDSSNRYRWSESWTRSELLAALGRGLAEHAGWRVGSPRRVRRLEIEERTSSGRVARLVVETDDGRFTIRGDSARWVLRPEPDRILNSSRFELDGRVQGGEIVSLTAEGGGWGHGVGMCQMGAIGRARAGQSYREILRTYYQGTDIVRLY